MATVCEHVVTVTTPGDCVDVLVTDYGIAVNPLRPDLIACLDQAGIPHVPIETLKEKAYSWWAARRICSGRTRWSPCWRPGTAPSWTWCEKSSPTIRKTADFVSYLLSSVIP